MTALPLPDRKYVPGVTERHAEDAFDTIRDQAKAVTETATAVENPAWAYGLRLFDAGFWWEAHEVLEPVWMNARPNSAERAMTQAVIQLANGALKREMGAERAWRRLCAIALDLAAEATRVDAAPMGLAYADLERAAGAIAAGDAPKLGA
ncbi:MAG: DUF309 domain-containing protein [Pseudomonadota bacterium]